MDETYGEAFYVLGLISERAGAHELALGILRKEWSAGGRDEENTPEE